MIPSQEIHKTGFRVLYSGPGLSIRVKSNTGAITTSQTTEALLPHEKGWQHLHRNLEITPLQSSRAVSGGKSCRGPGPTLFPDGHLLSTVTRWMIPRALAPLKWNVEQWIRLKTQIYVPNRAWRPAGEGTRKFGHAQLGIETPDASPASKVQQRKPKHGEIAGTLALEGNQMQK